MSLRRIDGECAQMAITILSILKSISTMYGKDTISRFMPFDTDWDTVHHLYFSAIELCCDKQYDRYYEDYSIAVTGLMRDEMTEYYKLAYKFGELKGLTEKENTYLDGSFKCFNNTLGRIEHYTFGTRLQVNKRRKPRLMLVMEQEYYPNAEVIYELYSFFRYFGEMLPLLQSELKEIESQKSITIKKISSKKSTKKSTKRRKKAA